ncbi:ADP-L-glycero-D-manno-heptose-6-epimerase [uncultured delta proteobacterium]|uniref:ADP-L-glycero-D-manno-heptose-6-epimerase n=1 Tax=uncultured delta proteobacterium TaxID=34034 RepID=A0A212JPS7_9DELT|nr:ADP-L-glycero-D-manno-heptose-6-epimerase [uncultured delta proteobacterium]
MYIVTGGAGMIGSAMIWKLNALGITDILVVDHLGTSEKWKNLVNRAFTEYMPREIFLEKITRDALGYAIEGIFHMGACSSTTERDADYLFSNNTEYTKTLVRYALGKGIRIINASSAATYGNGAHGFDDNPEGLPRYKPLNAYGYSKHLVDLWAMREGVQDSFVSLKFFNVYGPNEYHKGDMRSVVAKAFLQVLETGRVRLFASDRAEYPDGGQMRDFIYVKDCADAMWWLMEHGNVNGLFNMGTGKARTWNDLARALFAGMGREERIEFIPLPEQLRGKYQYFTEAPMDRLALTGCPMPRHTLEDGVADYVRNYLTQDDPYL